MTEDEFKKAVEVCAFAVQRAKLVLDCIEGADETAKVFLNGAVATVLSWDAGWEYDNSVLDVYNQDFPVWLLFAEESAVLEWKAAEKAKADGVYRLRQQIDEERRLQEELETYRKLKAKYALREALSAAWTEK